MNTYKRCSVLLAALMALCLLPTAVIAGSYMGISVGQSSLELGKPNFTIDFDPKDIDLKDSDLGMKVFGGYRFTILAVEAAYMDLGKVEGGSGVFSEASGFSAFGMVHWPIGPASFFGKAGGFVWQSETSFGELVMGETKIKDDGFDLAYGIGIMIGLFDIDARLEYEYLNVGDSNDVSLVSVGVSYTF